MLKRAKLKNLHHPGHEKDQTEHQTGKENRPRAIQIRVHFSKLEVNAIMCATYRSRLMFPWSAVLRCKISGWHNSL
jgi:hypothetical protein